jgi:two-component system sensor histidine kinase ResE
MKRLINNLLTLVRTQPSQDTSHEVFTLNSVAKKAFDSLRNIAWEKKLEYVFRESKKLKIQGNAEVVEQALSIILENAIKYTPAGNVSMCIDSNNRKAATVEVTDTGIGIPADDIPHIFDRFYRVRTRIKIPGTGLGLAIAKKIVEDNKGKITVQSVVDKGSTFTVYLPLVS